MAKPALLSKKGVLATIKTEASIAKANFATINASPTKEQKAENRQYLAGLQRAAILIKDLPVQA